MVGVFQAVVLHLLQQTNTNEVQKAKQVYEALNAQLLDELPKLYELSIELIKECIARFIRAQKLFYIACVESLYKLPDVSVITAYSCMLDARAVLSFRTLTVQRTLLNVAKDDFS